MQKSQDKPLSEVYRSDRQLAERYGVHKSTIWTWCQQRNFPKPVKLSPGATRWRMSEVLEWESKEVA